MDLSRILYFTSTDTQKSTDFYITEISNIQHSLPFSCVGNHEEHFPKWTGNKELGVPVRSPPIRREPQCAYFWGPLLGSAVLLRLPSQLTLYHKALSDLLPSFIQQNSFSHLVFYFDVPGIKKQMVPSSHFLSVKLWNSFAIFEQFKMHCYIEKEEGRRGEASFLTLSTECYRKNRLKFFK